jgi:ABC-type Mn2+/Zn2+ transport system ATPase subunit
MLQKHIANHAHRGVEVEIDSTKMSSLQERRIWSISGGVLARVLKIDEW